ncbi:MAG: flagellar biosynthetic protein FliO, partial [Leptospiraceae bacterium]|nr:flagellar biosynthetic protein FliO [Leptospiraceae bacterium]
MEDIDRAWMESIQGSRTQPGNTFSNPGESAPSNSEGNPEEGAQPAAQNSPGPSRMFTQQEGPSFFSLFFRFILFMGLMGAGFYGLVRFMKKKSGIVSSGDGGPLRVVASISLMPGKYMQVVDMAGQLMVLGVSDQGVRLLQTVEDGSVADRIRLWEENRPEPADNFLQGLQGLLKTTDLRLWKSRNQKETKADFQSILSGR